ncbi:hypothetical protein Fmac_008115 [Flemingia macrophylla]|uniref:Myb/SANT-like domain-containing protein n=1 Tax=Flemingia macrophylla TaxID=520843 RepID=A0ABD1MYW6_9FABA
MQPSIIGYGGAACRGRRGGRLWLAFSESPTTPRVIFSNELPKLVALLRRPETDDLTGKAIAPDSSIAVREFTKWTDEMDFCLLSAMLDEARLGNRVDGSWITQAYNNMVESLRQSGLIGITKNNVKNMQKSLKDRWREGADRATGHMARTARQARRNITQSTFTIDLNDDVDNIPEDQPFDAGFAITYRSPPHVDSYSPGDATQSILSAASTGTGGTSSSRGTKRKAPMVVAIERINDLINEQINVMRRTSTVQYSESDIWEMLVGMNLPDEQIMVWHPVQDLLEKEIQWIEKEKRDQMIKYDNEFYHRVVLAPKLMDFRYFATSGLYFHHHLEFQGQKLTFTNIPEGIDYDRDTALVSMIRPEMQGRNVKNAGSLNINDRLLHYVYVHILAPRSSNFAQLLQEDIFMLWVIKNNMFINWPHFIMEHMIKCKDNDMHLPYAILITKIMSHYGVDLSTDAAIDLGWHHCFYKKTLKKLNVVNVDGVWQHGRVNQDHGQNAKDENQPMPEEHVADIGPQPPLQYDPQILSQIWSGIQGLQEGLQNLNINVNSGIHGLQEGLNTLTTNVNTGFSIVHSRIDDLEKRFDDFHQPFQ